MFFCAWPAVVYFQPMNASIVERTHAYLENTFLNEHNIISE